MLSIVKLTITVALLQLLAVVSAADKPTIRWLAWKQAPNFILEGKFKGQGVADSFTLSLQQALPQYNHVNVASNTRRYQTLIREEDVCVAWAWIVPGSEQFRTHSRPVSIAPPTGIQTLKSNHAVFGAAGEVLSLAKLLNTPGIRLGYLEDMTYSKRVHQLLEQYRDKGNIHFSSRDAVEFDLAMLDKKRLDYFFGFSGQAIFDAEVKGIANKYQFYNLEEMNSYTSMYSHCSKTVFGETVIDALDKVLTNQLLMQHLAVMERWYGKNPVYRKVFIDYVINQQDSKLVTNPGQ